MKKAVIILTVLAIFVSCNQQKTIQTYIVEKQDKPGFMSVDLPMSLIQLNSDKVPLDVVSIAIIIDRYAHSIYIHFH